ESTMARQTELLRRHNAVEIRGYSKRGVGILETTEPRSAEERILKLDESPWGTRGQTPRSAVGDDGSDPSSPMGSRPISSFLVLRYVIAQVSPWISRPDRRTHDVPSMPDRACHPSDPSIAPY